MDTKEKELDLEEMSFEVMTEDGVKKRVEVILTFESEETNKKYMIYTDNETDEDGNLNTYASIYDEVENGINLIPIETEKEWKTVEMVLKEAQSEFMENEQ